MYATEILRVWPALAGSEVVDEFVGANTRGSIQVLRTREGHRCQPVLMINGMRDDEGGILIRLESRKTSRLWEVRDFLAPRPLPKSSIIHDGRDSSAYNTGGAHATSRM
jgi:hypothetical protein